MSSYYLVCFLCLLSDVFASEHSECGQNKTGRGMGNRDGVKKGRKERKKEERERERGPTPQANTSSNMLSVFCTREFVVVVG